MRSLAIVLGEPGIKISLQLRDRAVDLLAERHAVELVEQRFVWKRSRMPLVCGLLALVRV